MEIANFFFYGDLTKFEITCINSFVNNGFKVNLWSYDNVQISGVETCDANIILDKNKMFDIKQEHPNLSDEISNFAAFSDYFRFTLMGKFGGWWFDTDCYCLKNEKKYKELRLDKDLIAFYETDNFIGSACFYINNNSNISNLLLDEFQSLYSENIDNVVKWGTYGPQFLTNFIDKYNLHECVFDSNLVYSIHWNEHDLFTNPEKKEEGFNKIKDSFLTHIWHTFIQINNVDKDNPPVNSLLFDLYETKK